MNLRDIISIVGDEIAKDIEARVHEDDRLARALAKSIRASSNEIIARVLRRTDLDPEKTLLTSDS